MKEISMLPAEGSCDRSEFGFDSGMQPAVVCSLQSVALSPSGRR